MDLTKLSLPELEALLKQVEGAKNQKPQRQLDAKDRAMMDPTAGQPWWENAAAGLGKWGFDTARGLGQMVGAVSREEVDEAKKRDAPLMDTGAGFAGNLVGHIGSALALPAATIPKALGTGAGLGFIQPVGTKDSRLENAAVGGLFGAAVPAGVAALKGGRAIAEPMLAPNRTAARILEQFADDPQAMRLAAQGAQDILPGSKTTLAQAVQQPGISTLERSMANQPGPLQKAITDRYMEQNAARIAALRGVGQDETAVTRAIADRQAATAPLYEAAGRLMVKADDELTSLLSRPSIKSAWERAAKLAKEKGETLTVGLDAPATKATTGVLDSSGKEITREVAESFKDYSGRGLHYLKMALDDMIDSGPAAGIGKNERSALVGTKEKLVAWMDDKLAGYGDARKTYAAKSQPINEMQFGQELERRITPALSDVAGGPASRLLPERFAAALRDSDAAIKKATGKDLSIDQVLSPGAKDSVFGVAKDLDRASRASSLGKPTGSPTAQYLTTQNLMRQVAGPAGMPAGLADRATSALMATPGVGGVAQFLTKGADQRVQAELAQMLMDPKTAAQAFALINKQPGMAGKLAGGAVPYLPALGVSGMFANR